MSPRTSSRHPPGLRLAGAASWAEAMKRMAAALLGLLALTVVRAEPSPLPPPATWAQVGADVPAGSSVDQVAALPDAHFAAYNPGKTRRSEAATVRQPIWLKLRLPAAGGEPHPAILTVGRGYEDFVDLFLPDGAGGWRRLRGGETVSPAERAWPGLHTAFPVVLPTRGQELVAYVRIVERLRPAWTLTLISDVAEFEATESREIAFYFAYFGALGAIFAYNLFLYLRLRYRDLLYYLLYLAVFGVMLAVETFATALFVPLAGWRNTGTLALFNLSLAPLFLFVREYHELPARTPRLARVVLGIAGFWALAFGMVGVDLAQDTGFALYKIDALLILAALAAVPAISIMAWRSGARQARYFLIAFGCSVAGFGIATLNTFIHVLPAHTDDAIALAGSALEFVLLSFAIGDRFRLIREEKEALQAGYTQRLERDVGVRTAELVRLNLEKEELMDVVAHDLRAPLAALRGTALLVRASPTLTAPDDREALDEIGHAADRMHLLASGLLGRHATETGQVPVNLVNADAWAALADAARRFRDVAATKQQTLALGPAAPPAIALHDPALLGQVLDNFVSNALKFSPPGAVVRLVASRSVNGAVRLAVHDAGPGLSDADRTKVFQPFARLDARPTGGEESTGFGLAAARKLTLAMGGAIGAENAATGSGAIFWVEFPAA